MSLLLDALKKAAEAKNRQPLGGVDPDEADLIALEDSTGASAEPPRGAPKPPLAEAPARAPVPPPVVTPQPPLGTDRMEPPRAATAETTAPAVPEPVPPPVAVPPAARPRREAPPAPREASPDALYDEFDETQQLNTDELRAELLGSGSYGSRDHARAVFASKEVRKPLRQRPSVLVLLLVVLLLILAAGWVYYGYGERDFKLQRELAGIRSRAPITSLSQSEAPAGGEQPARQTAAPIARVEEASSGQPQPTQPVDGASDATSAPVSRSGTDRVAAAPPRQTAPEKDSVTLTGDAGTTSAQAPRPQATTPVRRAAPGKPAEAPASAAPGAAPASANLSIARREQSAPIDVLLQRGYRAYQGGRIEEARLAYADALRLDARNRDALLGAAAVAFVGGDTALAVGLYQRLLTLDPRDPAAVIGLQALGKQADPARLESELRSLLQQSPDSAPLHFALGGVYSRQQRWAEAQQAYFNAYRVAPANPDYLYNLAVSLDNLGKRGAAAGFYRQALQAARGQLSSFDQAAALARLNQLDEGAQ